MKIEIDQSGRIEETQRDTILAYADGKNYAIKIPARVKRQLQNDFRKIGKPKLFTYKTFAAGIYLLIKNLARDCQITIDVEYLGKNQLIKDILIEIYQKNQKKKFNHHLIFRSIGKGSRAHELAISVFRKKKIAHKTISYQELKKLIIKKSPR